MLDLLNAGFLLHNYIISIKLLWTFLAQSRIRIMKLMGSWSDVCCCHGLLFVRVSLKASSQVSSGKVFEQVHLFQMLFRIEYIKKLLSQKETELY